MLLRCRGAGAMVLLPEGLMRECVIARAGGINDNIELSELAEKGATLQECCAVG